MGRRADYPREDNSVEGHENQEQEKGNCKGLGKSIVNLLAQLHVHYLVEFLLFDQLNDLFSHIFRAKTK